SAHWMIQFAMVFVERFRLYRENSRSWRASGIPFTYLAFMIPATRDGVAALPFRRDGVFSGRFMAPHFGLLYSRVTSSTTSNRANSRSWRARGMPFTYFAFMIPATRDGVAALPFRRDVVFSGRFMAPHFGQLYTKVTSSPTSNRAGMNFSRFTVSFVTTLYFVLQSGQ